MPVFGMKNISSPYGRDVLESVFFPLKYIFTFAVLYSRQTLSSFSTKGLRRVHTLNHFLRCQNIKGELKPEISLLHLKVLALIKAKSNVCP